VTESEQVHVRLSDPGLAHDFVDFLRRADWTARLGDVEAHANGIVVDVDVPSAYDEKKARKALALYLRGWEAVYPGSSAELLD
jgi:hypothetical protein